MTQSGHRLLIDDALVAEMNVGELGVSVFEVRQRDSSGRPGRAAACFGDAELNAFGRLDTRAVLGSSHWVPDRLADRLDDAGHPNMTAPRFDIDGDLDRQKQRLQLVRAHRREYPPYGGHIIGLAAGEDFQQGIALVFIGALVDNHLHRAVAFVDRARPACYQSGSQPIKADRTKMPLLDLVTDDRAAIAMSRQGSEFAGAAIGTIAVG